MNQKCTVKQWSLQFHTVQHWAQYYQHNRLTICIQHCLYYDKLKHLYILTRHIKIPCWVHSKFIPLSPHDLIWHFCASLLSLTRVLITIIIILASIQGSTTFLIWPIKNILIRIIYHGESRIVLCDWWFCKMQDQGSYPEVTINVSLHPVLGKQ